MAAPRYWPLVSFVAGEISPKLRGRFDIAQYRQACETLINFHPMVHGGVTRRAGTQRMADANSGSGRSRLAHFHASDGGSFIIEFSASAIRVIDVTGSESTATLTAPWTQPQGWVVDYAQAEDTMVIVHPDVAPYRLTRHGAESWSLDAVPFYPQPTARDAEWFASNAFSPAGTGTGSVTFTGSLLGSDVGRIIRRGAGYGTITACTPGVSFTVNVERGFVASTEPFILEGQPNVTMTPSGTGPVGATIQMTGGGDWRTASGDNRVIRIHGGSVLLTTNVSSTVMNAVVLDELSATTAVAPTGWTMEFPTWSSLRGYPRAVTFHEQRLWFGGWDAEPQGIVASGVGLFYDFRRTDLVTDAFDYRLATKSSNVIEYLVSDADLVALTRGAEIALERTNAGAISAENPPRPRRRSNHGCARVRPVEVNGEVVFVTRHEQAVMAMYYDGDAGQYLIRDISLLAEHLLREGQGVVDLAYCKSPVPTVYVVRADGNVVACTYDPAEQVIGWWRYETEGTVESMAVGMDTNEDVLWLQASRGVGRTIERARPRKYARKADFDAGNEEGRVGLHVDCAEVTDSLSIISSVPANAAANGSDMRVIADGYDAGDLTVASGAVALPASYGTRYAAVGYAYSSVLRPMPPELPSAQGTGMGRPLRKGPGYVKTWRTLGGTIKHPDAASGFALTPAPVWPVDGYDQALAYQTGQHEVDLSGWDEDKAPVEIRQDLALPITILSLTIRASNAP